VCAGTYAGAVHAVVLAKPSQEASMSIRHVLLAISVAIGACAADQSTDSSTPEDTTAVEQGILTCGYFNTGAWGCHSDDWCDARCKRDADGSSPFGWADHCEWHTGHWETVCECCSF
jgi:hypothetical protein